MKTYCWLSPETLKFINENPQVLNLLYDLGLLPEEISAKVRGYVEEELKAVTLQVREAEGKLAHCEANLTIERHEAKVEARAANEARRAALDVQDNLQRLLGAFREALHEIAKHEPAPHYLDSNSQPVTCFGCVHAYKIASDALKENKTEK